MSGCGSDDSKARIENPDELLGLALGPSTLGSGSPSGGAFDSRGREPLASLLDLSDFENVTEIARGGMAAIFQARQCSLGRVVALKVLTAEKAGDVLLRERFRIEAEAVAQLDHAHIVPIYEVNDEASCPYFVMRLMEGGDLAGWLEKEKASPEFGEKSYLLRACRLMEKVARAVHFAHQRGIIHRDLKPGNILMDDAGEPHISDFGLAKLTELNIDLTQTNAIMGTPAYMSPEQASGHSSDVAVTSDVFSLGSILYELLRGEVPFPGKNQIEVLKKVVDEDPAPFASKLTSLSSDIELICQKALSKESAGRYQSALELAEDLERWRLGLPIRAIGPSFSYRLRKFARRNRPWVYATTLFVFAISFIGVAVLNDATERRDEAIVNRLLESQLSALPGLFSEHRSFSTGVVDGLNALKPRAASDQIIRIWLALLPRDQSVLPQINDQIEQASPQLLEVILARYADANIDSTSWLEEKVRANNGSGDATLRWSAALAHFSPESDVFRDLAPSLSAVLIRQDPSQIAGWTPFFLPVRELLSPELESAFGSDANADALANASFVLSVFHQDDAEKLCKLVVSATPRQFPYLVERLREFDSGDWMPLHDVLSQTVSMDGDPELRAAEIQRLSRAAIALFQLGDPQSVVRILRSGATRDPRLRSFLIHNFSEYNVLPERLAELLSDDVTPEIAAGLLSALGDYDSVWLTAAARESLRPAIERIYQTTADAGLRSMALWLANQWFGDSSIHNSSVVLNELGNGDAIQGNCLTTSSGIRMTTFEANLVFQMGSPESEIAHQSRESLHWRQIPRAFAVAWEPVTFKEFERSKPGFFEEYLKGPNRAGDKKFPNNRSPVEKINGESMMAYCNWLTKFEGGADADLCYEYAESGELQRKDKWLSLPGYRLLTEAEWEFSARAGSGTSRFYGNSTALIDHYAWHKGNSNGRAQRAIIKRPNALGLFGLYGPYYEVCEGNQQLYPTNSSQMAPLLDTGDIPTRAGFTIQRGAIYTGDASLIRTASRHVRGGSWMATNPTGATFRVAKTILQP